MICSWHDDRDGSWESDCRKIFIFNEGGPIANGFQFCPFCGKPIGEDECDENEWDEDEDELISPA